jgi:hypothetical protein
MPVGYKPSVFVSSTCYDLNQIRTDVKCHIELLGLDPVLSELSSFPVNPSQDTIRNCRDNVKNRADIFILIVGGRYGYQHKSGKSVTNLEYIEAKNKGIPIYIFVSKEILHILPVWQKNKEGDFTSFVDTPKLFEFVDSLRNTSENWVFPFDNAQDINSTIKQQLPYLFMDALNVKRNVEKKGINIDDSKYCPKSLQILINKDSGWEYLLFTELLKTYIQQLQEKRRDLEYGISFIKKTSFDNVSDLSNWLGSHISEISYTTKSLDKLINEGLSVAFGKKGESGDEKHIQYIAQRISEIYGKYIDWSLELITLNVDDNFLELVTLCSKLTGSCIEEIECFSIQAHEKINNVLDNLDDTKETTLSLTLTLTVPDDIVMKIEEETKRLCSLI